MSLEASSVIVIPSQPDIFSPTVTGSGEDEPMFLNPNIPLEYRKQLLLRDLFGESSFGTSEDL